MSQTVPSKKSWTNCSEKQNIEVFPSGSNNGFGNLQPPKQLAPGVGETLITGIAGIAANKADYIKDFVNTTVFLPVTLFSPGLERKIEIFSFIGNFYGLYATSSYNTTRTHSDYCFDTQEYDNNDVRNGSCRQLK